MFVWTCKYFKKNFKWSQIKLEQIDKKNLNLGNLETIALYLPVSHVGPANSLNAQSHRNRPSCHCSAHTPAFLHGELSHASIHIGDTAENVKYEVNCHTHPYTWGTWLKMWNMVWAVTHIHMGETAENVKYEVKCHTHPYTWGTRLKMWNMRWTVTRIHTHGGNGWKCEIWGELSHASIHMGDTAENVKYSRVSMAQFADLCGDLYRNNLNLMCLCSKLLDI